MIKNWLNYYRNLWNKALESKLSIFTSGFICGLLVDIENIFLSIPAFVWIVLPFGLVGICYFFYVKYKINQDTFGDF